MRHGLVGDRADPGDDVLRHQRRRLCIDDHDALVAHDHARVRVAFRGVGVESLADFGERDRLVRRVRGRGKIRRHGQISSTCCSIAPKML
jgi:hypothetical protein